MILKVKCLKNQRNIAPTCRAMSNRLPTAQRKFDKRIDHWRRTGRNLFSPHPVLGGKEKSKSKKVRKVKLIKEAPDDVEEVIEEHLPAAPSVISQLGAASRHRHPSSCWTLQKKNSANTSRHALQRQAGIGMSILKTLFERNRLGKKSLAVLVDPDKSKIHRVWDN